MRENSINIISSAGSLLSSTNIISITDKILKERSKDLILSNPFLYLKRIEMENLIISFIIKNFYYYIGKIISGCAEQNFKENQIDINFYEVLIDNDKNYEYPRAFYRQRGEGVGSPDNIYDKEVFEKCGEFVWCSPPKDAEFDRILLDNINCKIAGKVLTHFDQTSISTLLSYKIRYYES